MIGLLPILAFQFLFQFLPLKAPVTVWNPTGLLAVVEGSDLQYYFVPPFQKAQLPAQDWVYTPAGVMAWVTIEGQDYQGTQANTRWVIRTDGERLGLALESNQKLATTVAFTFIADDGDIYSNAVAMGNGRYVGFLSEIMPDWPKSMGPGALFISSTQPIAIVAASCSDVGCKPAKIVVGNNQ